MRIAVFSDIHGNQYAFLEFLRQIKNISIDRFYFLGDVFGYYYGQNQCLDELRKMNNLICIKGNHDDFFLKLKENRIDKEYLAEKYGNTYLHYEEITLANYQFIRGWNVAWEGTIDGCKLGFFHGTVENIINGRLYPDTEVLYKERYAAYDIVFLGHTHHKMYRQIGNTRVYNPGSIGQQRDGKGCSYILFDTISESVKWEIVQYDKFPLLQQIAIQDLGKESLSEVLFRKIREENLNGNL